MATNTREKGVKRAESRDKRPQAHVKYVRISPRKVKIVIDLIRGKNADEALAILQYTPKAAAPVVNYGWLLEFLLHSWAHQIFIAAQTFTSQQIGGFGGKYPAVREAQEKQGA